MKDPGLVGLVHRLGWQEGLLVVSDPGIIDPKEFLREVEEERFPNPFLGDTPSRIATDTSQKIPIRFGETVKSYLADDSLKLRHCGRSRSFSLPGVGTLWALLTMVNRWSCPRSAA